MMAQLSPFERSFYYHGVGGKLLTRTSKFEFPERPIEDLGSICFTTLGGHEIVSLWSDEITTCLQEALGELNWNRFYPIRTKVSWAYNSENLNDLRNAVVLIVEVPCGRVSGDEATTAAWRCRAILRRFNILDVEVEMREIDRRPYAMDDDLKKSIDQQDWARQFRPFGDAVDVSYETFLPALTHIGYEITPEFETPTRYGTMGLHVRLSNRPSEAYGLTCRHVAHRPVSEFGENKEALWAADEEEYRLEKDSSEKHRILQMCPGNLEDMKFHVHREIDEAEKELRDLDLAETKHISDATQFPELSQDDCYMQSLLRKGTKVLGDVEAALSTDQLEEADARAIGHIAFMPPFEVSRTSGFIRDWALIRLDKAKFKQGDEITNQIFVSSLDINDLRKATLKLEALKDMETFIKAERDKQGMIRLRGSLSAAPSRHGSDRKAMGVGKRGATSKLTFGATNEIKAVVRRHSKDGGLVTWEWIVVSADASTPFSKAGDSGAVMFNSEGRVIGVISAGCPDGAADQRPFGKSSAEQLSTASHRDYAANVDLSFVTPVDVVVADIRHVTGSEVEII